MKKFVISEEEKKHIRGLYETIGNDDSEPKKPNGCPVDESDWYYNVYNNIYSHRDVVPKYSESEQTICKCFITSKNNYAIRLLEDPKYKNFCYSGNPKGK